MTFRPSRRSTSLVPTTPMTFPRASRRGTLILRTKTADPLGDLRGSSYVYRGRPVLMMRSSSLRNLPAASAPQDKSKSVWPTTACGFGRPAQLCEHLVAAKVSQLPVLPEDDKREGVEEPPREARTRVRDLSGMACVLRLLRACSLPRIRPQRARTWSVTEASGTTPSCASRQMPSRLSKHWAICRQISGSTAGRRSRAHGRVPGVPRQGRPRDGRRGGGLRSFSGSRAPEGRGRSR